MKIRELNEYDQFLALKSEWDDFLEKSKDDNIFLTWEWLSTWWKYYGNRRKLLILLVEDENDIYAIAPLMCSQYRLFGIKLSKIEFIGAGPSDYSNFILAEEKEESLRILMDYLNDCSVEWDCLDLKEIPETAECVELLRRLSNSYPLKERVTSICPYVPLPNSLETFTRKLTGKTMLRLLRRLGEKYKVEFKTYIDIGSVEEAMNIFFELHQRRWRSKGLPGMFSNQLVRDFHLDAAERFAERGWLNLSFLTVDDEPISSDYSFQYGGKVYWYSSGFDPAYSKYSPGNLLMMHLIEDCIRKEMKEIDFLRGGEAHKFSWASFSRKNFGLTSIRRGLVPAIKMNSIFTARKLKTTIRRVFNQT